MSSGEGIGRRRGERGAGQGNAGKCSLPLRWTCQTAAAQAGNRLRRRREEKVGSVGGRARPAEMYDVGIWGVEDGPGIARIKTWNAAFEAVACARLRSPACGPHRASRAPPKAYR